METRHVFLHYSYLLLYTYFILATLIFFKHVYLYFSTGIHAINLDLVYFPVLDLILIGSTSATCVTFQSQYNLWT